MFRFFFLQLTDKTTKKNVVENKFMAGQFSVSNQLVSLFVSIRVKLIYVWVVDKIEFEPESTIKKNRIGNMLLPVSRSRNIYTILYAR